MSFLRFASYSYECVKFESFGKKSSNWPIQEPWLSVTFKSLPSSSNWGRRMAEYAKEIPTTMWNEDAMAAPIIYAKQID